MIEKHRIYTGLLDPKLFVKSHNIFVFGSNEAGRHGKGAARTAMQLGATYGQGMGMQGNTYAIPTKDAYLHILDLRTISQYINIFSNYVIIAPELVFYVTDIGCGLSKYSAEDIAPLFKEIMNLENVRFSQNFANVLNNL